MSARLIHLSKSAREQALARGVRTPTERYEFNHLPVTRVDGVPVFDATRMRDDQVQEVTARLERITGRMEAVDVRSQVSTYMEAYGRFGLRVKDVMDALSASKPVVLKYLRELSEDGKVRIAEEKTRGDTGSKRKRYFWTENVQLARLQEIDDLGDGLQLISDVSSTVKAPAVFDHGTVPGGFQCTCGSCRDALVEGMLAEERSAALRNGTNQLVPGLELRRVRRERADRIATEAVAAGLAASHGA